MLESYDSEFGNWRSSTLRLTTSHLGRWSLDRLLEEEVTLQSGATFLGIEIDKLDGPY